MLNPVLIMEDPAIAGPPLVFRKLQNHSTLVRNRQSQGHHLDILLMVKVGRLLKLPAPKQHIRIAQGVFESLHGALGRIRTSGARIRSPMLYPLSYERVDVV